jgi:hypothetical protein
LYKILYAFARASPGRQAIDQPLGAIGLEVPADLVELLAGISHHPAGLADIVAAFDR